MAPRTPFSPDDVGGINEESESWHAEENEADAVEPSINGNSIEVVPPQVVARRTTGRADMTRQMTVSHRDDGRIQTRYRVWEDMSNKSLPPKDSATMMKFLEKDVDKRVRRTYVEGRPRPEVDERAAVPFIGICFLPGADKPQVNRLEQINMAGGEQDQQTALWRVNTAGDMLIQYDVSKDLSVSNTYKSKEMATVAERARSRLLKDSKRALSRNPSAASEESSNSPSARSLSHRIGLSITIDSQNVHIVEDLRYHNWDMQCTLIEVDGSALVNLMVNYRHLISKGGPEMTFDETRELLDVMIEDARRLCIRSPVLFRMATRGTIINSTELRYGVYHHTMFRTMSTSQGIKEIISISGSYYNSLDPDGKDDRTQKLIKPRFLQMVVVLLSLLNDQDLADIKDFLESTYKLNASRQHLELLFLKVIPLLSINSKVFLKSLVPAVEGFPLPKPFSDEQCWDIFTQRILDQGYLLPGTVSDLGRETHSWIVKWPEDGFKSTSVFRNMQYGGRRLRAMNDIPTFETHPESALNELTVILANGQSYTIGSSDLEKIMFLNPGRYSVQEAKIGGRNYDLVIEEVHINHELYSAIQKVNAIVHELNIRASLHKPTVKDKILRRKVDEVLLLHSLSYSGRLTKSVATLHRDHLAMAYKIDGRKVTTNESVRTMVNDIGDVHRLLLLIEQRTSEVANESAAKRTLHAELASIRTHLSLADSYRNELDHQENQQDEPIIKVLYPDGSVSGKSAPVWNDYVAWYKSERDGDSNLRVEAEVSTVSHVLWRSSVNIEIAVRDRAALFFVTPLREVQADKREDEVVVGDVVFFMGQYLAIGVRVENDPKERYFMTNYLKIVSVMEGRSSGRGQNRLRPTQRKVTSIFR